jgi:hypothetical protein
VAYRFACPGNARVSAPGNCRYVLDILKIFGCPFFNIEESYLAAVRLDGGVLETRLQ